MDNAHQIDAIYPQPECKPHTFFVIGILPQTLDLENFATAINAISALTLLVWRQEGHLACKKLELWGTGMVICLERDADLHMAQLMSLPLTVSCSSKIQIGFTFLVPAHPGSPGKRAVKRVCMCVTPASSLTDVYSVQKLMLFIHSVSVNLIPFLSFCE